MARPSSAPWVPRGPASTSSTSPSRHGRHAHPRRSPPTSSSSPSLTASSRAGTPRGSPSWLPDGRVRRRRPRAGTAEPDELKTRALPALVQGKDARRRRGRPPPPDPRGAREPRGAKMVVTPHAGEFERLFGRRSPKTSRRGSAIVKKAAGEHNSMVVLLKGPTDVDERRGEGRAQRHALARDDRGWDGRRPHRRDGGLPPRDWGASRPPAALPTSTGSRAPRPRTSLVSTSRLRRGRVASRRR